MAHKGAQTARFVVQEHWATTHHFDLRLERGGVLLSWAVPKGLPEKVGQKRLAVRTEDHHLSYLTFEGEIEEGYGKGRVRIFDKGTYQMESEGERRLVVRLEGEKIRGRFALVGAGLGGEPRNWLIIRLKG